MKGNTFSMSKKLTTTDITRAGILIAISLVLNLILMFYIPIAGFPQIKITLSSAITMATGIICGPFIGIACGAIVDIVTTIIRPAGPYFFGFTFAAMIIGGLPAFLYRKTNFKSTTYTALNIISVILISIGVVFAFVIKKTISISENGSILFAGEASYFTIFIIVFSIIVIGYVTVPILLMKFQKDKKLANKVLFCVSVTQLIASILLNTYFLSLLYGKGFLFYLPSRIVTNFFVIPLYSSIIITIIKIAEKMKIV